MNPISTVLTLPAPAAERLARFQARDARIGIIGLGYVGLPLSLLFVEAGFQVTGFDIDQAKVEALLQGRSYIYRISADEIESARRKGFSATSDFACIAEQDAVILCVPTPLNSQHEPDLSYIENTARTIAPFLKAAQLIVLESTTYPGTTEELLIPLLEAGSGLTAQTRTQPVEQAGSAGVFYAAF